MDATEPKEVVAALAEGGALPAEANKPIEKIPFYIDPSAFDSVEGVEELVCNLPRDSSEFALIDNVPRTKLVTQIYQLQKQVATDAKLVGKLRVQITDLELELQESKHRELDLKKKLQKVRFDGRNRAEPNSIPANQRSGKVASKERRSKKAPAASRTTAKGEGLKTRTKESSWMLA